jgi:RNA recognition motif-containing protein
MPVRLFVGNLSYEATEAELREHFGTIGPVTYCYLPTDRESGRPLAVKEAQPRESRPAGAGPRSFGPPGGGGGGPRPYSPGPGGPPRPYGGPPRESAFGGPPSPASAARERNFGPDAPPKGKRKPTFNRKDQQGPKGPIRTKTNNRIYSAFGDDEEESAATGEFDDFATSLGPDAPDEE